MSLLNRLERALGRFAIPNLSFWLVLGQVLFLGLAVLGRLDLERIELLPAAVRAGEVWRLVTYLFLPMGSAGSMLSAIFLAFTLYIFYLMGSALEHYWGDFRYNAYVFIGWALTTAGSFIFPLTYATNIFIFLSVFLAFAWLNPEFELLLFFILPVKIKWLALLQWVGYAYLLAVGDWPLRVMILASVGGYLLFFSRDIFLSIRSGRRRMVQQARRAGVQNDEAEPRHRCHACGKTDLTHPQLDFRYCSQCAGEECYCSEHIANHVHTTAVARKG